MTDTTHEAPERIWIDAWGGKWPPASGGTQGIEYVRADLVRAAVVAALTEAAESVALPMDGRNAKAQADYMSKVIASAIREGGE